MAGTDDSAATTGGTPDDAAAAAATADASAQGSKQGGQDDSTLASRYAGQTAKVNVLTGEKAAAEARAKAAEEKLAAYEAGKVGNDEALKSQLEAERQATAAAVKDAAMARIEARFPETFAELGEDAAALTEEKLASMEARLKGVAVAAAEPPTPGAHNESRTSAAGAGKAAKAQTADDLRAALLAGPAPDWAPTADLDGWLKG